MSGFTLLWNKILNSSIWDEDAPTRVVWITLLALKDENGMVVSTMDSLRRHSNVTPEECRKAIECFEAPDPSSGSPNEEGRRIIKVHGGWQVVNHEKYRYSSEERRIYWRQQKAKQRKTEPAEKKKSKIPVKSPPLPGENAYLRGVDLGAMDQYGVPIPPREHPAD